MKTRLILLAVLCLLLYPIEARAQWARIPGPPGGLEIHALGIHPMDAQVWYAGCKGNVYRSSDGGKNWKRLLTFKSASSVAHDVWVDPVLPETLYVGTDEGLYVSRDAGKKWSLAYRGSDEMSRQVLAVRSKSGSPNEILVGTSKGLYASTDSGIQWTLITRFREVPVYQISHTGTDSEAMLAATSEGLYLANPPYLNWRRIYYSAEGGKEDSPEEALIPAAGDGQFSLDQISLSRRPVSFAVGYKPDEVMVLDHKDLAFAHLGRFKSGRIKQGALGSEGVLPPVPLGSSSSLVVLASRNSLQGLDVKTGVLKPLHQGLGALDINALRFDAANDRLLASTDRGLFMLEHPEIALMFEERLSQKSLRVDAVLSAFKHEPVILELQEIAARYAEVHPEKIIEWRRRAAHKALMPTVSMGMDKSRAQNVDLDRGGTNDPDRFIIGPEEEDADFSFDVSWDLSELIWNPDQTSIDTRSKLMVELRDEILNELNHLYYARRRLQVESLLSGEESVDRSLERQIQIDEYTAGLDALTGGEFSRRVGPVLHDAATQD